LRWRTQLISLERRKPYRRPKCAANRSPGGHRQWPRGISAIAVRHGLGKSLKAFVSLPLLPANCVASKHKVIGRVPDAHLPAILGLIDEFDRRRLIVELKHAPIMLVLVQPREFDAVALGLDGHAHLAACVPNGDVACCA